MTACGSVLIQDRRVFVKRVILKAEVNQIDEELFFDLFSPTGTEVSGGTLTNLEDTNEISLYDVIVTVTDTSGGTLTATLEDVGIPNLAVIIATKDDYVGWPIEGTGVDIQIVKA